jgi:glycosyltransferase involved in cell wall biosynthesis
MKILYIHQYFRTPREPGGNRSYWIAQELIKNGYKVTMLTTSTDISSKIEKKTINGIDVIYLKTPYNQKMNFLDRLSSFLSFMFRATRVAIKMNKIDLVIATSTPLTIGFPALVLKKVKKTPYIFEVRDLWPEVPIQMGGLKNPYLIKFANWFEKYIYENACHIVALSPGMADGVRRKGVLDSKISIISNMAKIDAFWSREKNFDLMEHFGLRKDSFKVIHFGALGLANGAMTIIESAKLLKGSSEIEFVFIGGGSTEEDLIKECKKHGMTNVHFLGSFAMDKTSEIVNICDLSVVSFMDLPILFTNSPNKLFDSLSAGKPIIVNSAGWTKDLVEQSNCGFYVDPNRPQELVDRILYLQLNPEIVNNMGIASRKLAERKYDKSILSKQFVDVVKQVSIN